MKKRKHKLMTVTALKMIESDFKIPMRSQKGELCSDLL